MKTESNFFVYNDRGDILNIGQYAYLFQDLSHKSDGELLEHYKLYGQYEIQAITRYPERGHIAACIAQNLSDFPYIAPSNFALYKPALSSREWLNVIFSHTNIPEGKFAFSGVTATSSSACLFLNARGNDWYQHGIPQFAHNLQELAKIIRKIAGRFGHKNIRIIGSSMGAYAAIVTGDLLDADEVVAGDPELVIGEVNYRSWQANKNIDYNKIPKFASQMALKLGDRLKLYFSHLDPMESKNIQIALENDIKFRATDALHGRALSAVNWNKFFSKNTTIDEAIDNQQNFSGIEDVSLYIAMEKVFHLSCQRNYQTARDVIECAVQKLPSLNGYKSILSYLVGNEGDASSSYLKLIRYEAENGRRLDHQLFVECAERFSLDETDSKGLIEFYRPIFNWAQIWN